jgi:hypothetical protein
MEERPATSKYREYRLKYYADNRDRILLREHQRYINKRDSGVKSHTPRPTHEQENEVRKRVDIGKLNSYSTQIEKIDYVGSIYNEVMNREMSYSKLYKFIKTL